MFSTRLGRRLIGGALVVSTAVALVIGARGRQKTAAEAAPAFRQQGLASARVVIAEFSDFQCPGCKAAEPIVKGILALYGKDVRFVFKHFPWPQHPWAKTAALAAECAGAQGKFWPLHDVIYEKQEEWSQDPAAKERFLKYALQLGIEEKTFSACLADPAAEAAIKADMQEGRDRWVGSTPTFFINGKRFAGGMQLSSKGSLWIEKLLKK